MCCQVASASTTPNVYFMVIRLCRTHTPRPVLSRANPVITLQYSQLSFIANIGGGNSFVIPSHLRDPKPAIRTLVIIAIFKTATVASFFSILSFAFFFCCFLLIYCFVLVSKIVRGIFFFCSSLLF